MNAEERARFAVQSLLVRGLGASEVARRTGLAGASEVWGGDVPRDRPAWYLWLADAPGAYQLGLEDAEALAAGGWRARFTIRYYPAAVDPVLGSFSAAEQAVVRDGLLDATGTPRIEAASAIPEMLFAVGSLDWAASDAGEATAIGLSSLDRLLARDAAGAPVREVPGWRLSAALLSTLAGLHAQVERGALRRLVLSRRPGFEVAAAEEPSIRDGGETVQGEAVLLFEGPSPSGPSAAGTTLLESLVEPASELLADETFHGACRHPKSLEADPRLSLAVSHAWFGGEAVPEDRISCAC